eukprot:GHVN01010380.1.p1 GENE.GHVN01010380.1~~GHVN01010380.1.p1  ORF type:complete len:114 (-),score=8.92 GHVN01010380.1:74-415(-)
MATQGGMALWGKYQTSERNGLFPNTPLEQEIWAENTDSWFHQSMIIKSQPHFKIKTKMHLNVESTVPDPTILKGKTVAGTIAFDITIETRKLLKEVEETSWEPTSWVERRDAV